MTRQLNELRDAYIERDKQLGICEHISQMRPPREACYAEMLNEDYLIAFEAYLAACERVQTLLHNYQSARGIT